MQKASRPVKGLSVDKRNLTIPDKVVETMRLFISVQFKDPMINALEAFQSRLKASGVEGYFAVRENLHLTLAFIGDYGASDEVMDV